MKETTPVETPAEEAVTFTATTDATKTVLNNENKSVWVAGDQITIFNGEQGYTFKTSQSGSCVAFQYTGSDFKENSKYMAVYPSGKNADLTAKTVTATIPTAQPSCPDTYNPAAAVAVAYAENDTDLHFKNVAALIKFKIKGNNIKQVVFFGNKEEKVSGDINITLNEDNTIKSVVGTETYAELWADTDNNHFEQGPTYYLAVVPQVYSKGFTVQVKLEGEEHNIVKVENEYRLDPNTILNIGELTYGESAPTWSVAGAFNGWQAQAMDYKDGLYVLEDVANLHKQDNPGFKFIHNGKDWHGTGANDGKMTSGAWEYLWGGDNNGSNIYVETAAATDKFDIYLNPDAGEHGRFVIVPAGTSVPKDDLAGGSDSTQDSEEETPTKCKLTIRVNKNIDWYDKYIFAWTSGNLCGAWPGAKTEWDKEDGNYYVYYYVFDASLDGTTINYIINKGEAGNGNQTKDLQVTLNGAETVVTIETSDKK